MLNTVLWIVQILLGALMLTLGLMKTFLPVEKLGRFKWTSHRPKSFVRFVGISELLIGAGLFLPWLTGIMPMLTSMAAASLCIIMVLAMAEHIKQKETNEISKNVIILLLAAFVAAGRFVPFECQEYGAFERVEPTKLNLSNTSNSILQTLKQKTSWTKC